MTCILSLPHPILIDGILPLLDWNSRLNLNLGLPVRNRCCLRFSKAEADYHDRRTIIDTMRSRLLLIEDTLLPKRILYVSELFLMLIRPRYRFMLEMEKNFKRTVSAKLAEYSNGSALKRTLIRCDKEQLNELARLSRLVRKTLALPVKWITGKQGYTQKPLWLIRPNS